LDGGAVATAAVSSGFGESVSDAVSFGCAPARIVGAPAGRLVRAAGPTGTRRRSGGARGRSSTFAVGTRLPAEVWAMSFTFVMGTTGWAGALWPAVGRSTDADAVTGAVEGAAAWPTPLVGRPMRAWRAMPKAISRPANARPVEMSIELRRLAKPELSPPVPKGPAATDATIGAIEILDGGGGMGTCEGGDQ